MKDFEDLVADVKEIKTDIKILVKDSATNTSDLKNHMARTLASENRLDRVENWTMSILMAFLGASLYFFFKR